MSVSKVQSYKNACSSFFCLDQTNCTAALKATENPDIHHVLHTHLNVDKDSVVGLVQHFVAFGVQRELKGNLSLSSRDFSSLGHFNVTADQLDGLQHVSM